MKYDCALSNRIYHNSLTEYKCPDLVKVILHVNPSSSQRHNKIRSIMMNDSRWFPLSLRFDVITYAPLTRAVPKKHRTNPPVPRPWRTDARLVRPLPSAELSPTQTRNRPEQHAWWRVWRQPPNTNVSYGRSRARTLTVLAQHSGK